MSSTIVDYTGRIDPATLHQHGVSGVVRYLSWLHRWDGQNHPGVNPKIIQKPEADQLLSGGQSLTLVWEFDARDWLGGHDAAVAHAQEAIAQARSIGYTPGCLILGACDFDITAEQWSGAGYAYAMAWDHAIRAGGYRPGGYLPFDGIEFARHAGLLDVYWQAGLSRAWSRGRNATRHPAAQLYQHDQANIAGELVDVNTAYVDDWGQMRPTGSVILLPPPGDIVSGWSTVSRTNTTPEATRTVQGLLLARGYPVGSRSGGPDGSWGDVTDASVRRFQVEHHVPNSVTAGGTGDGQVGANTLRALLEIG